MKDRDIAMKKWGVIIIVALAAFPACLLQFYDLNLAQFDYLVNRNPTGDAFVGHSLWLFLPAIFLGMHPPRKFTIQTCRHIVRDKNNGKIAVFTGREAKKNLAIFEILSIYGPLSIREIQKLLNKRGLEITYHASLSKRIHALERDGYIAQIRQVSASPRGSRASLYEVCDKFYLARFLNINTSEGILSNLTDPHPGIVLADLVNAGVQTNENSRTIRKLKKIT